VLQGGQMDEVLRLGPLRLEGQGVVEKHRDLGLALRDADPSVGCVPAFDQRRVVPPRHRPVERRGQEKPQQERAAEAEGRDPPAAAAAARRRQRGRRGGDERAATAREKF
jgi:hypothetical protein